MEHVKCVTIISSIVTKNNVTTKMLQRHGNVKDVALGDVLVDSSRAKVLTWHPTMSRWLKRFVKLLGQVEDGVGSEIMRERCTLRNKI